MILARAALAPLEVVLEVRVTRADLCHTGERGIGERCAAEIRVHEHTGRVEHASERGTARAVELAEDAVDDRAWIRALLDLVARAPEDRPRGGEHELARLAGKPLVAEQLVDGGKVAELHAESVGTSSRTRAVTDPAARAPTSSTAS